MSIWLHACRALYRAILLAAIRSTPSIVTVLFFLIAVGIGPFCRNAVRPCYINRHFGDVLREKRSSRFTGTSNLAHLPHPSFVLKGIYIASPFEWC